MTYQSLEKLLPIPAQRLFPRQLERSPYLKHKNKATLTDVMVQQAFTVFVVFVATIFGLCMEDLISASLVLKKQANLKLLLRRLKQSSSQNCSQCLKHVCDARKRLDNKLVFSLCSFYLSFHLNSLRDTLASTVSQMNQCFYP